MGNQFLVLLMVLSLQLVFTAQLLGVIFRLTRLLARKVVTQQHFIQRFHLFTLTVTLYCMSLVHLVVEHHQDMLTYP